METSTALHTTYNGTSAEEANNSNIDWSYLNENYTSNTSYEDVGRNLSPSFAYAMSIVNCFFFILGLFGNFSILLIVMQSFNRINPYSLLVLSLAISDLLSLTTNSVNQLTLLEIVKVDIRALTDTGCKLFMSVQQAMVFLSLSIIVLICIERFIVVVFPLKAKGILSRKVTIGSLGICGVLVLMIGVLPSALYSQVNGGRCRFNVNSNENISAVPIRLVAYSSVIILPVMIILILTSIVIYKLYQQRVIRVSLTNQERSIGHFGKSIMLIAVVLAYVILVGIPSTLYIIFQLDRYDTDTVNTIIARVSILTCFQVNHSTNILVYGFSNVQIRKQLLSMFGFSCKRSHSPTEENYGNVARKTNFTIQMQNM